MDKITIERETLLPCPFCGCGAAITGTEWGGREQYFVACTGPDCHCAVGENYDRDACPEYSFSSKDDAIAAWNRRAALAAQPAEPAYTHADVAEAHAKGYALGLRQVDRPHPTDAQPTGQSPCARHCEAPAFEGEIRRLKRELQTQAERIRVLREALEVATNWLSDDRHPIGWTVDRLRAALEATR